MKKKYRPDLMSVSPLGGRIITITIAILLFIVLLVLGSCGPAYHLQRSEHHKQRAIDKGATVKKDTITFHFKTPEIKFSTTVKPEWLNGAPIPLWRDTIIVKDEKSGATIKSKITAKDDCPDDCIETVYLSAEIPEQDHTAEIPCETVQAGYTGWELIGTCVAVGAVCILVGMFIQGRRK